MTRQELFRLLRRCNSAQLTAITTQLNLNTSYLPSTGAPTAERASEMLALVTQGSRFSELEIALREIFPDETVDDGKDKGQKDQAQKTKRILILSANPIETDRLAIDREIRIIKDRLNEGEAGRSYQIEIQPAVRVTDLSKYLLQYEPAIVHFSGHGSPTGEIVLEDDSGKASPLPVDRLARLFEILKGSTECVLLNACYSLEKADILRRYVGCVVGMEKSIGDPSALSFSAGFYRGLAFGKDYRVSFQLGCNEIDLVALPDASIPHFTTRDEDRIGGATIAAGVPSELVVPQRSWGDAKRRGIESEQPDTPRLYPVWFGTNRQPIDPADLTKGFSNNRALDETAVYHGICKVVIPKSHKFGSVGSSWWKRFLTWDDDRLRLQEIEPLERDPFWASARQALAQAEKGERMALVFIHGFRVTFEEAAIRAAQIGFDLKIPGLTGFFSWPSRGRLSIPDYMADEASISASVESITDFLVRFATQTDAERVHVMAHSMGNRGLLQAMQRIVAVAAEQARKPFRHIVFAAPDEDATTFRNLAKLHSSIADHATLYVSSHDRAVASSGLLHKESRAGFVPPVTQVPGISTIEVSNVDLTLLGHGYYSAAGPVLNDMRALIVHDELPQSRQRVSGTAEGYWRIDA